MSAKALQANSKLRICSRHFPMTACGILSSGASKKPGSENPKLPRSRGPCTTRAKIRFTFRRTSARTARLVLSPRPGLGAHHQTAQGTAAHRWHGQGTAQLSEYIFHRDGAPVGEFKKSWTTATKAAKCEGLLFHDLRRTYARRLLSFRECLRRLLRPSWAMKRTAFLIGTPSLMLPCNSRRKRKSRRSFRVSPEGEFGQNRTMHQNAARASEEQFRQPFVFLNFMVRPG